MRQLTLSLLVCAVMTGCATQAKDYTNLTAASEEANSRFVSDSIKQIEQLYPPARTQLVVRQAATDAYGVALVLALRAKGYGVRELNSKEVASEGIGIRYVLDLRGQGDLYRLGLVVGETTLSRAYILQNDTAMPAGAWLRKE